MSTVTIVPVSGGRLAVRVTYPSGRFATVATYTARYQAEAHAARLRQEES